MKKPAVVLFDLGNVLVQYRPQSFWECLGLGAAELRNPLLSAVSSATAYFEMGQISTDEYFDLLVRVFGGKFRRQKIVDAAASVLTTPVDGMDRLVRRIAKRAEIALVSNTNQFHYAYCVREVPAMAQFSKQYLSFRMGVMKPSAEFYQHVLRDQRRRASTMMFVDDVEENVAGARSAGMRGIIFTGAGELEANLRKTGLV
ncbi:MAG TPA: HAD-IA family hydrolase [Bacteroidota bacterium]|nr:HAD-IA family hydrolase [Bacteroidota bacterium]